MGQMIIKMKEAAQAADIEYVVARVHSLGFSTHLSIDRGQTLVGVMGRRILRSQRRFPAFGE